MSSHKNQHYVPRCLLRPFSAKTEGKAINLFNIEANRFIANAPVKSQCSRNFFYGADLGTEQALAELEGHYARVAELIRSKIDIGDNDANWLRIFSLVQTRRTAQAVARLQDFMTQMADEVFRDHPEQRPAEPTHDELVITSMKQGLNLARHIDDLKLIFLDNQTDIEFSVSDHPSVVSNRFNFERSDVKGFGLASSGTFIVLPISPRIAAFFFDIGVYTVSIPRGTRFVKLSQRADVRALNELQQLNTEQNVYFSNWAEREKLIVRDEQIAKQRELRPRVQMFRRDPTLPGTAFRTSEGSGGNAPGQSLLQMGSQHPRPRSWPSFLKFRKGPVTYSNGSLAGDVRKPKWLRPGALSDPYDRYGDLTDLVD
jgi:hypothetical protein